MVILRNDVLTSVRHQLPERVPAYVEGFDDEQTLCRAFGMADVQALLDRLGVSVREVITPLSDVYVGNTPQDENGHHLDPFGVPFSCTYADVVGIHPLAGAESIAEVETYSWPNPDHFESELSKRLTVMIRTCGKGTVYKNDAIIWDFKEQDANVARQMTILLSNGVPALSVDLRKLPVSHKRIVKRWLEFYQSHQQEFILSDFQALGCNPVFPNIVRESEKSCFIYISSNPFFLAELGKVDSRIYIFNLTECERLDVRPKGIREGNYRTEIYDCFLNLVKEFRTQVDTGEEAPILTLQVPQGGLVQLNLG